MYILGIQGSPRKQGNSSTLLSVFLAEAQQCGSETFTLEIASKKIHPCIGCGTCEREGFCALQDDMQEIYPLLRKADVIVVATPIFFYNVPAQLKALIDRCQTLWSRKYIHKISDPGHQWRKGYVLAVGATKGKNLFVGLMLTMKYFFDAAGADYSDSLTFRKIDQQGEINTHLTALKNAREKAGFLVKPFLARKKILFLCNENSCRSQMAQAFAQIYGGDKVEPESAGSMPGEKINDLMVAVMKEKGIDMAFRIPKSFRALSPSFTPDIIVSMGCGGECPFFPSASRRDWNLPDPTNQPITVMRALRDEIEKKVRNLLMTI
ncbi:MAG TPA: NAD(P)H-dependent oxidoreductase [Thermodesulfobacteriota bacterium]|nr:NAD(P)H-dependent oxidoreductase [Thermodesulfobacteriota bacterium]